MTKDPELQAQARILAALKDLDPETLARVLDWIPKRFGKAKTVTITDSRLEAWLAAANHVTAHAVDVQGTNPAGSMREPPKLGRDA